MFFYREQATIFVRKLVKFTINSKMFLTELTPLAQKLLQQPIAFAGGFCSGLFKLDLSEEPLSVWLEKQGYSSDNDDDQNNGKSSGPQSISIE